LPALAGGQFSRSSIPDLYRNTAPLYATPSGGGPVVNNYYTTTYDNVTVDLKGAKELLEYGEFVADLPRSHQVVMGRGRR